MSRPHFERIIREGEDFTDSSAWAAKFAQIKKQVCRIEIKLNNREDWHTHGTGFLVGPGIVLTNYHVLEPIIKVEENFIKGDEVLWAKPEHVIFRFDFITLPGNRLTNEGTVYKLAAKEWLIDFSPMSKYDEASETNKDEMPAPYELDYALVRLTNGSITKTSKLELLSRGWIDIAAQSGKLDKDNPIIIVQHPRQDPLSQAAGNIIEVNANHTRVRYTINTEQGSSGSPCFDFNWNLVALHHVGNLGTKDSLAYNQGIPITAIKAQLEQRGFLKELLGPKPTIDYDDNIADPSSPLLKEEVYRICIATFSGKLKEPELFPHHHIDESLHDYYLLLHSNTSIIWEVYDPVDSQSKALELGKLSQATLVIWGRLRGTQIKPFIEILGDVPKLCNHQSASWLTIDMLFPKRIEIDELGHATVEQLVDYANCIALLCLGLVSIIGKETKQAEGLITEAIKLASSKKIFRKQPFEAYYWRGVARSLQEKYGAARDDLDIANPPTSRSIYILMQQGIVNLLIGRVKAAQINLEKALPLTRNLKNKIYLLINIGLTLELQGKAEQAYQTYQNAWKINQKLDSPFSIVNNLLVFGNFCLHQALYDDALYFFKCALDRCKEKKLLYGKACTLNYFGILNHKLGFLNDAQEHHKRALKIYENLEDICGQSVQLTQIGLLYLKQNRLEKARQSFKAARDLCQGQSNSPYGQAQALIGLGLIERVIGNNENALLYIKEAEKLLEMISSPEVELTRYFVASTQYSFRKHNEVIIANQTPYVFESGKVDCAELEKRIVKLRDKLGSYPIEKYKEKFRLQFPNYPSNRLDRIFAGILMSDTATWFIDHIDLISSSDF